MARGTRDQTARILDVVITNQFLSEGQLIRRRLPVHVEDFLARSQIFPDIPMTIETPFHVHRIDGYRYCHLVHPAMTR